jgi:hypothetical protein
LRKHICKALLSTASPTCFSSLTVKQFIWRVDLFHKVTPEYFLSLSIIPFPCFIFSWLILSTWISSLIIKLS